MMLTLANIPIPPDTIQAGKQINLLHLAVLCHNSIPYLNNSPLVLMHSFAHNLARSPRRKAPPAPDRIPANSFIFAALLLPRVFIFGA